MVHAPTRVGGRGDHQLAHHLRVADGDLKGYAAPHTVAEEISLFDRKVLDQGGDVVRHQLVGERAIYVGGAPMPLQLHSDDLPGLGEGRHNLSHQIDRHVGAVKQDQRLSGAVDLIVYVQAVHLSIVASNIVAHFVVLLVSSR